MIKKPYALYLIVFMLIASCSTKKNTFKNRNYHKLTAWFNTLFNGQEAMDRQLKELRDSHEDNYFETLTVNPYDEFQVNDNPEIIEAPQPPRGSGIGSRLATGNLLGDQANSTRAGFEKAEEKALKAISNHAMIIRNEEKNKLMARAYLMLGQARYYQGKPFQALDALEQVKRLPFDKHTSTAAFYTALANLQAGNTFAATKTLDELYKNDDLDKQLIADVAKEYAWLYYEEGDLASALNGLDRAIEYSRSKKERARLNYIQGQVLTELGRLDEANEKFKRAAKLKPGFEMEARAQVFAAMNYDPMVHNYQDYRKQITDAYETGTYETYRNEFLYALGKIEEKRDSIQLAEKAYLQALREEQSDPRFRAETYTALGDIKFKKNDYVYAAAYYDSAVSVIPEGNRSVEITQFRDNLNRVMDKYYLVKRNDSILRLVNMPAGEQKIYFQNYIDKLKEMDAKKAEEEVQLEETTTNFLVNVNNQSSSLFGLSQGGKFYFYTNAAKNNGETEFKKVWGNRRLTDNWRLSSSGMTTIEQKKAELTGSTNLNNPRRYDIDFYLEQIPTQPRKIQNLKVERDTVELSLGLDYADQFKNNKRATTTLEHLVNTPPQDEDVLLRAYYNLYRINVEENPSLSDVYKQKILNDFPHTIYAEYILNPQSDFTESNEPEVLALYTSAYEAYQEEEYDEVRSVTEKAAAVYPNAEIMAKFLMLNAFVDAKVLGRDAYIEALERIILLYPTKEEGIRAKELLQGLKNDAQQTKEQLKTPEKEVKPKPIPSTPQREPQNEVQQNRIREIRKDKTIRPVRKPIGNSLGGELNP
ncbi:tetratricopeptide repeat protein [Flavobacteriaceae bacterium Ap0902]|nr:tetratricopeptide repeat protein [Flavobacteriaceae bacterium Ap0902]